MIATGLIGGDGMERRHRASICEPTRFPARSEVTHRLGPLFGDDEDHVWRHHHYQPRHSGDLRPSSSRIST